MSRAALAGLFLWAIACGGAEPEESVLRGRVVNELMQLATMGARQELGERGGGVTTQIQSLCAMGLYLLTAPEQRSVLPFDFGEYQDALDPPDRRVAW